MKNHIKNILAFKSEAAKKLEKYILKNNLIVMERGWRHPYESNVVSHKFDCKSYLKSCRHSFGFNDPDNKFVCNDLLSHTSEDYSCYDLVTNKDLEDFEKKDWPKIIEPYQHKHDVLIIKSEIEKLRKQEDNIKQKLSELMARLAK